MAQGGSAAFWLSFARRSACSLFALAEEPDCGNATTAARQNKAAVKTNDLTR